eukprot:10740405-Prorocentrum_lima.AAC.1
MDDFEIDQDWTYENLPFPLQTMLFKCRPHLTQVEAPASSSGAQQAPLQQERARLQQDAAPPPS